MVKNSGGNYDQAFVAEHYDNVYDRLHRLDVQFYVDYAKKTPGSILELGCGTGRVLIPIAAAGKKITGLDYSPLMLQRCREKLALQPTAAGEMATLIQGDMTKFNLEEKFSLITMPFRPFQHLITVREQKACLQCVRRHLDKEGLLVFDVFQPFLPRLTDTRYLMEIDVEPEMALPDGRKVRRTNRTAAFHPAEQYNDIELIYYIKYPDGRRERQVHAFPMRYFFRTKMEHLLELSGFEIIDFFGNFDRTPFTENSPEMIFTAKKAGN
ncbi:MAG: methyltransferase domain-containing protein [Dehalococcoidales bacterium]|nr:methyltransferase domain-containing protein [Dehalococcoidales bacterium]